jgi:hypothetical protein
MPGIDVAPEMAEAALAAKPTFAPDLIAMGAPAAMPPTVPPGSWTPDWPNKPLLTERPATPVLATMPTVVLVVAGAAAVFFAALPFQLFGL